ncbi:hypothetical protein BLNAU_22434 [Blattamonas nauphoetae]|uniref:Uncharacterized protein n=1 Tax=Blattamonas nauphoetae TaxID=2049346 RepID=A0ABQ9WT20_9EUKA|nr:hypothetical protein BLNAU_22434 [Blattamonas nauphoetae]
MRRRRINVQTVLDQVHLEGDEIIVPTSTTSDWRVILQDSITADDLRQGCISLFDQVNTEMKLTPIEVNHAVRFLKYAEIHINHHKHPHNELLDAILCEATGSPTEIVSVLVKLVCHPSDTLRTATLSFLDVGIFRSTSEFESTVTSAGLLPQLFEKLTPHKIPLDGTTIEFHRHFASIVVNLFDFWIRSCPHHETLASETMDPIFQPFCTHVQYLLVAPVCPAGDHSGPSLLLETTILSNHIMSHPSRPSSPKIEGFFDELRKNMTNELASWLDIATTEELSSLLFGKGVWMSEQRWVEIFERCLARASEGKTFSNLGVTAFMCFVSRCPCNVGSVFWPDGTFSLKMGDTVVSSSKLDSKALWTLFTPTQLHHATTILNALRWFLVYADRAIYMKHIWNEWFPNFSNAVNPSKLPFTVGFISFHTNLVSILRVYLDQIRDYEPARTSSLTDQLRGELDELSLAFYTQTKDYVVHLSLHPFALDDEYHDTILDFLDRLFRCDCEYNKTRSFRAELRQKMDESAISSSSPPFILTSELACRLSDEEIVNIVDKIVGLLDSDSPLDDDTILRICTFIRMQLSRVYLPDLFRKAGRSNEQYLHAFESLLSLNVDYLDRAPIRYLLSTWPKELQQALDEWDDVDLERVGIVKGMIDQNQHSDEFEPKTFESLVVDFAIRSLSQARHSAARLSQPQLEQLLAPSVDVVSKHFIQLRSFEKWGDERHQKMFVDVCYCCDQRAVAQCVSRIGFFSRFVTALFNDNPNTSEAFFRMIVTAKLVLK